MPNSPQKAALESEADILFFGGAAGGGKTDLLLGLALTQHERSIIFRREFKQLQAIEDRAQQVLGTRDGFNSQKMVWRLGGDRQLEFGACQHTGDEQAYQGRPHDLKAFDEITHFTEAQFRFLCGWKRTTNPEQRTRVVAAGNPPTDSDGDWVIQYWGPWLDDTHPNPAKPGELRWYATIDGEDTEVESGEPFEHDGETIKPVSRTFIPSHVEDNPYLMATDYKATLQALPEPLRSQMLRGDFTAGRDDNPWQIIPSAWVHAAQERWKEREKPQRNMTAIGCDPARGGADEMTLAPRYGDWYAELECYPGASVPDGPAAAALVVSRMRDGARIGIDVIGIGSSVYDHLKGSGVRCLAMDARERSDELDRNKVLGFANKRSEWWWRFREDLDPTRDPTICLPPDSKLTADLCAPRWRHTARGVQVELKEDIIKRLGRSTDRGDAVVMAHATPAYVAVPDDWTKPMTPKRGTIA